MNKCNLLCMKKNLLNINPNESFRAKINISRSSSQKNTVIQYYCKNSFILTIYNFSNFRNFSNVTTVKFLLSITLLSVSIRKTFEM